MGSKEKIHLTINSPGGDSYCALALYKELVARNVEVTIAGRCCSAAVTVALAGRTVRIDPEASMMVHQPVTYVLGGSAELRRKAECLKRITRETVEILVERTGQPRRVVNRWMSADTWFSSSQALGAGLVDEVLSLARISHGPRDEAVAPEGEGPALNQPKAGPTLEEQLFLDWLKAFGKLPVRSKEKFVREMKVWFAYSVLGEDG